MATGHGPAERPSLKLRRGDDGMLLIERDSLLLVLSDRGYGDLATAIAGGIIAAEADAFLRNQGGASDPR